MFKGYQLVHIINHGRQEIKKKFKNKRTLLKKKKSNPSHFQPYFIKFMHLTIIEKHKTL